MFMGWAEEGHPPGGLGRRSRVAEGNFESMQPISQGKQGVGGGGRCQEMSGGLVPPELAGSRSASVHCVL